MDPLTSTTKAKEAITVTPEQIIYQRRQRVMAHAANSNNVAETCRIFGISRTSFYRWQLRAEQYGIEALLPKTRRSPQLPNATPTWVVEELIGLAIQRPTLGCRPLADRMGDKGHQISKTTVQKILLDHNLGTRAQRLARAAALATLVSGIVTEAARDDAIFGFCHCAANPGDLVAMDSFYIGHLKGVGKVYQMTAVDTATRWAVVLLTLGPPDGKLAVKFLAYAIRRFGRLGIQFRNVLTDNGPEWVSLTFKGALGGHGFTHIRIPARSPNYNAVCERFQGTALQECWRPAFHRRLFISVAQLQAEADAWLVDYNTRRRNHGDFMKGRTPKQVLEAHQKRLAS
jgi:transposase InsO family protein